MSGARHPVSNAPGQPCHSSCGVNVAVEAKSLLRRYRFTSFGRHPVADVDILADELPAHRVGVKVMSRRAGIAVEYVPLDALSRASNDSGQVTPEATTVDIGGWHGRALLGGDGVVIQAIISPPALAADPDGYVCRVEFHHRRSLDENGLSCKTSGCNTHNVVAAEVLVIASNSGGLFYKWSRGCDEFVKLLIKRRPASLA